MLFFFRRPTKCTTVIYETLDTLTEALEAVTIRLSFADRQTDKSKDQAPKQHHYLGRKNNQIIFLEWALQKERKLVLTI